MPRISLWFFAVAPVYLICGMCLGIYMGASDDHVLYPAHAHLNLLGWATMALYGTFYGLAREQASNRLAWTTFVLANVSTILMFPTLALVLKFGALPQYIIPLALSEFLALFGALCFTASVWGVLRKQSATANPNAKIATASAAE